MKKVLIIHNKNIKFEDKQKLINILDNTIDKYLEEITKENKYMEEEIQDKLEKIYNDYIRIEVNKFDDRRFEIVGHIKIRKGDTISLSFYFIYEYDKNLTIDANIHYIIKEIDLYS